MSQPLLQGASRVARLTRRSTPAAFFHQCRATPIANTYTSESGALAMRSGASTSQLRNTKLSRNPSSLLRDTKRRPATARAFSATTPSYATVVTQNPRTDEDGQDMIIEISPRAAKRLQQITDKSSSSTHAPSTLVKTTPEHSHLRVTVTSGGCHGFQYLMSLEAASKVDAEEDTIFTAEANTGAGRAEVVMDLASLELLKGSTIDFTTELIGSQFKITGNPRAKSSCGCGTSFDID